MYEYHNNLLSIPARLLYKDLGLMSYKSYNLQCFRGKLIRTKQGKGNGNEAMLSFHDLPEDIKTKVMQKLGDNKDITIWNELEEYLVPDRNAIDYFTSHKTPSGKPLCFKKQREKATSAMILNAISMVFKTKGKRGSMRLKWDNISQSVNNINATKWSYSLPTNARTLQRKYNKYLKEGYSVFIHKGEGSFNARIVTESIERLIISLYCLPNKPYSSSVHDMYLQFLGGGIEVFDLKTGELFDREDFYEDDAPVEISESTVWNIIKSPRNELVIKKARNGNYDFSHKNRPHVNRTAPNYSMSKISLDDRDIMHTKMHDGRRVKAYYAFDVMSTAMIGISHSKNKDNKLFTDCIKNMFQFTTGKDLGVPMQMEVEHHLVRNFKDGLMKAGNLFPFVRWCNATNSQEKYSERLIGSKKYGVEKDNNQNVGRHYARTDSNRVTNDKIFDSENDNYKEAKADYSDIVANDIRESLEFNNELHPNQKKYEGMTRMDVFLHHINPNLPKLEVNQLARYIGEHTSTSIRRSQYVRVNYGKYQLPNPQILERLLPNNYTVDAYYLPNKNNEVKEVYIYQNGEYICQCTPVPTFNRANAEWTDKDVEGYQESTKYISKFDKMVKDDTAVGLAKVGIIKNRDTISQKVEVLSKKEALFEIASLDDIAIENRAINDI